MRTIIGLVLQTEWRYVKFQWAQKHTTKVKRRKVVSGLVCAISKWRCPYYKGELDLCGNKKCSNYALFNDERLADAFKKYRSSGLKLRDKLCFLFGEEKVAAAFEQYKSRKLMLIDNLYDNGKK